MTSRIAESISSRGKTAVADNADGTNNSDGTSPSALNNTSNTIPLRCATSNVCVFPFVTRNKYAVLQFLCGWITGILLLELLHRFVIAPAVSLPFILSSLRWFAFPFLALPLTPITIPLEGLILVLLSRGTWHDHKTGRLKLLIDELEQYDCIAVQELFSGIFDTRYRDFVIREAAKRGLKYSVACDRLPEFPALLLNTGTLILSRYPIVDSRKIVFQNRAFFDYPIVNRGASWAKIQLPNGRVVHFFTCHVAPPLEEVAGRGGRLFKICECKQLKQLEELMNFMKDCILSSRLQNSSEVCDIVLAGDFNLDCGSLRYFHLLQSLQLVARSIPGFNKDIRDLFAVEGDARSYAQHFLPEEGRLAGPDQEDGEDALTASPSAVPRIRPSKRVSAVPSAATASTASSPRSSASPLSLVWNEWHHERGNDREQFLSEELKPYSEVIASRQRISWPSTFGQKLPADFREHQEHLEEFLTHDTLLGSHSTHDYFFSSATGVNQTVEPFFTPQAAQQFRAFETKLNATHLLNGALPATSATVWNAKETFTQLSDHCALVATLLVDEE